MVTFKELQTKHHLPQELESLFPVEDLEKETTLRGILDLIYDIVGDAVKLLEGVVQLDSSFNHMVEAGNIKDRRAAFETYKKLMLLQREMDIVFLENDEKSTVSCIKSSVVGWKSVKPEVLKIAHSIKDAWCAPTKYEHDEKYFG